MPRSRSIGIPDSSYGDLELKRLRRVPELKTLVLFFVAFVPIVSQAQELPRNLAVTGRLETVEGVRVLKVWGGSFERGFAHGYLLAPEILRHTETILTLPLVAKDPADYKQRIVQGALSRMRVDSELEDEMKGIVAGVKQAVGQERMHLTRLGKDFSISEVLAMNTLADWMAMGCSSFSAWGDAAADGRMITARNLDYFLFPESREAQLLICHTELPLGQHRWVTVGWPGLIGAYTAMNEEGVTISMHDAHGPPVTTEGRVVPRAFALREAVETATAELTPVEVRQVLASSKALRGNIVHVSAPFHNQTYPAVVFEYDGDTSRDSGVTMRTAADQTDDKLKQVVLSTNHYRKRGAIIECSRYAAMEGRLRELLGAGKKVDVEAARTIMESASVDPGLRGVATLHSVVFLPNKLELWVGLATADVNGAKVNPVRFRFDDLMKRKP